MCVKMRIDATVIRRVALKRDAGGTGVQEAVNDDDHNVQPEFSSSWDREKREQRSRLSRDHTLWSLHGL